MLVECDTGDRLEGLYRGIVLKHLPHGKCKIFIPGVHSPSWYDDPDLLPTAQQKACLFAGTNEGNGVFTYPNLSTIVWCQFLNGDVNYPIYDSVTLGGEDAFGQYDLIKKKDEPVSERHMITSGKTHMLWYEKGLLSGIVEDPIRTQCTVKYDKFELENNNTSADNKYSYEITNELQEKVDKNEISNINCQYVFDNDGGVHGELSVSTHWYDIISAFLSDEMYTAKGQISTDSFIKLNNDGLFNFDTLSTFSLNEISGKEGVTVTSQSTTHNKQKYTVDNSFENLLEQQSLNINVSQDGTTKTLSSQSKCEEKRGNKADRSIDTSAELTSIFIDVPNKKTINSIDSVDNLEEILSCGAFNRYSKAKTTYISADQNAGQLYSKILDLNLTDVKNVAKGNLKTEFLSSLTLVTVNSPVTMNKNSQLTSSVESDVNGKIRMLVKHDFSLVSEFLKEFIKSSDSTKQSIDGTHEHKLKYNKGMGVDSPTETVIDNKLDFLEDISNDATFEVQAIGKKLSNQTPNIDGLYHHQVNASSCKSTLTFIDNMVNNEHGNIIDVKTGKQEVFITSRQTGAKCHVIMKSDGTFELQATTQVKVKTPTVIVEADDITMTGGNSITMKSAAITLDGPTHCTNVMTVDVDTVTAKVSFNGHIHTNGNMGSPTGPRIP